jgi:ribonuclease III
MRADVESLEVRVGHCFSDREVLRRALTHSSHAHEQTGATVDLSRDNEQLEFLGDSVLGFLVSELLVERFPSYSEGRLSTLKAHLVSAVHLHKVAQELDLGQYLQLGRSEEKTGGRAKKTLLVNAVEALIAALYLDGGLETARAFVAGRVLAAADLAEADPEHPAVGDFKGALQELARARKLPAPRYSVVREYGPEHSKTFTVEVRIGKDWAAQGEGFSKKSAAQKAARDVYQHLQGGTAGE